MSFCGSTSMNSIPLEMPSIDFHIHININKYSHHYIRFSINDRSSNSILYLSSNSFVSFRSSGSGSYAALSVAVKGMNNTSRGVLGGVGAMTTGGMGRSHALGPSTPALDVMEMSETECDRDNRRQGAPPVSGGRRRNTSFSIAVWMS